MRLLLLFYPWLELLSLIQLGIETSAMVPLLWVLAMFMLGAALIKRVGTASVLRLREAQQSGVLQQSLFLDDVAVAVAALLLMIPGLISDFFAIVVLIGPLRRFLARLLTGKLASQSSASGRHNSASTPRPVALTFGRLRSTRVNIRIFLKTFHKATPGPPPRANCLGIHKSVRCPSSSSSSSSSADPSYRLSRRKNCRSVPRATPSIIHSAPPTGCAQRVYRCRRRLRAIAITG